MRGRYPELKPIEGGLSDLPPAPSHIPKSARPDWDRVVADLRSRQLLHDSTLPLIASYVIAIWQIAECVKAIEKDGAFVRTKTGEPKPHPAHGLMNKANEIVARLGGELGLSPAARSRKGMQGHDEKPDSDATALGV
ncbi:MAG: phage terminase small subunit P27 family [Pseudorhodoplanes sp.]|jgi:P27 family predicted phage terminase small subunit|nr:phage terminase small subunit P27 family [Pseudorhodoplanes sp.]